MTTGRLHITIAIFITLFYLGITLSTCFGEIEEHEIKYDDGAFERIFKWSLPRRGYMLAVRFTPRETPSKLFKVSFYIKEPNPFIIRVFDDTRKSLFEKSAWPTQEGWFIVDLSGFNIIVNGDFYIALESNPAASNNPWLGGDISNPDGRSYWVSPEEGWQTVEDVAREKGDTDYNADFGIRVTLVPIDSIVIDFSPRMGYIIVNNTTYSSNKLPITLDYLRGSVLTVKVDQEVIWVSNTTRFVFAGWNDGSREKVRQITVSRGLRLTGFWKKQFLLTIISKHLSSPGGGWYDEGDTANISLPNTEILGGYPGEKMVFTGWSGDIQSIDSSISIMMDRPKIIYANWKTQYLLNIESGYGNPRGGGWYDEGTTAYFEVDGLVDHDNGTRRIFLSWLGDIETTGPKGSIFMNSPKRIIAKWKKQYYVKASSQFSSFTGGNGWYDEGDTITIRLKETVVGFIIRDVFDHFEGIGSRDRIIENGVLEIYVDSPKEIKAIWRKDYTQLAILLIFLFICIAAVMLVIKRKRVSVGKEARIKEGTEIITEREEHLKRLQKELEKYKLYLARLEEEKSKGALSDQVYNALKVQYDSEIRRIIDEIDGKKARKLGH